MNDNIEIKKIGKFDWNFTEFLNSLSDDEKKEREIAAARYEEQEKQERILIRFKRCGLGEEYLKLNFDNFFAESEAQSQMKDKALEFCEDVKAGNTRNLILAGNCGTGKTHIIAAILKSFAGHEKKCVCDMPVYSTIKYTTSSGISEALSDARKFKSSETESKVLQELGSYDVLAIDEVGRLDKKFESESGMLFKVLDKRYQNGKSTVLATNMDIETLMFFLGDATDSRLTAFGRGLFADTSGLSDFRNTENKTLRYFETAYQNSQERSA